MAERVEVEHAARLVAVGNLGGLEVHAQHVRRVPRQGEDGAARGLPGEPGTQASGQVRWERLHVRPAVLRVGRQDRHRRHIAIEVELLGHERAKLGGAEAGAEGEPVEHRPLGAADAHDLGPGLGGLDEPGGLGGGHGASLAPPVGRGVEDGQGREGVLPGPAVAMEPARERLDGAGVVVARLQAELLDIPELGEGGLDLRQVDR
ncbi:MAG TPA: hypothetical protein VG406_29340 [Isosphaeraceae bacterium]|nr:hypothetical protein [Isosphaeraceae bacterium]